MIREIITIDEELCNGCGDCIPNCHEGALQLIDGKARLISELMCDGLGACIGHCPQGAISIEKREAEAYNETTVISIMAQKGINTVNAHLEHLREHNEEDLLKEALDWLDANKDKLDFSLAEIKKSSRAKQESEFSLIPGTLHMENKPQASACGCSGSAPKELRPERREASQESDHESQLRQWPVQFHLVNPNAGYFQGADVLLAADCSAYTVGNFHSKYLSGKSLIIACPKLDSGLDSYFNKLVQLIDQSKINTLQVLMMEVPCCGGLLRLVKQALSHATRKVPVKATVISVKGEVLSEEWV